MLCGLFLALWVAVGGDVDWQRTLIEPWGEEMEMVRGPFRSMQECKDTRAGYHSQCFALVTRCLELPDGDPSRDAE